MPDYQVVQLDGISRIYHEHKHALPVHALRFVSLTIPQGQYLAIMGASGSGKSTLLNILGCLDQPTEGAYHLAGQDVAHLGDRALSRVRGHRLGFVFQSFNLIPQLNVVENVSVPLFYQHVPARECRRRVEKVLERVGLSDRGHHRPNELSGGQMQRAAIARALVTEPSLLLADEPCGNLDSGTSEQILSLFDDLHAEGLTVAMVTHDAVSAERAQRVICLSDGEIISDEMGFQAVP